MSLLAIIILIAMVVVGIMLLKFAIKVFFIFLPVILILFVIYWLSPGTFAFLSNSASNIVQQSGPAVEAGAEKVMKKSKDVANEAAETLRK